MQCSHSYCIHLFYDKILEKRYFTKYSIKFWIKIVIKYRYGLIMFKNVLENILKIQSEHFIYAGSLNKDSFNDIIVPFL